MLGLETFMTKTSTSGPNLATPFKKSDVLSGADDLFFPRFNARIEGVLAEGGWVATYDRRRERTIAWP